jgi:phytoene dehydrogenase-like protein
MDRAYQGRAQLRLEPGAIVEMLIPSTLDETLAPPRRPRGEPVLPARRPRAPEGRSWDDHRDEVADLMIDTVERHAPGFRASVVGRQALSPLDLERTFGLVGGDIFHGALSLDQLFSRAPDAGSRGLPRPGGGALPLRLGRPSGGGVTGARGTTPRGRCCGTTGRAGASAGRGGRGEAGLRNASGADGAA